MISPFIAFLSPSPLLFNAAHSAHRWRRRSCYTTPTRVFASAAGAGAGAQSWRPRDRDRLLNDDVVRAPSDEATLDAPKSELEVEEEVKEEHPIVREPTTNVAALQVDDGSLSATATMVYPLPRKLVRRRKPSLKTARESLLGSFLNSGVGGALTLASLFATWYGSNAMFNVYNKQVLRVFPYPLTCTVAQFLVGAVFMATLWGSRVKKAPPRSRALLMCVAPLAVCHAAGFLLTNMSLGKVSVAFTHTVKATEPFFSAALTPSILGDIPTWGIIGSLVPIVGGVALASATEASFNWVGFLCAVGSNVALQSRNVLSKKLMKDQGDPRVTVDIEKARALDALDNVNLFATMTIIAVGVLAPVALLWEGAPLLSTAALPSVTGMATSKLCWMLALGGACRCLDVLSSYMILQRVSPVTHSVGNCVKRAVVIAVSIVFFKTSMTWVTALGTCMALAGVLLYSLIVAACKQNTFGPDSPVCKPVYEKELELVEGSGI